MSAAEERMTESLPIEQSTTQLVSKAELDQQIETARAHPRSVTKFQRECFELATLNEQVAGECVYALPREGKTIEGPSARLAEIVAYAWGNCRAGARIVDEGREFITAQGVFHDLERNVAITYEVKRRITNRRGDRYSADMISVTANAACSIALRNAVFKGVPKALWSSVYQGARKVIAGDSKTLDARRSQALDLLQKVGVPRDRVLLRLGVDGIADIGLDEIVILQGLYNAIKESEVTPEEAFPAAAAPEAKPTGTKTDQAKEALRKTHKAEAANDTVPHFDEAGAITAIRSTTSAAQFRDITEQVARDFKETKREVPAAVIEASQEHQETLAKKSINACTKLRQLKSVYDEIVKGYGDEVPVAVEAAHNDRRLAIEQAEA